MRRRAFRNYGSNLHIASVEIGMDYPANVLTIKPVFMAIGTIPHALDRNIFTFSSNLLQVQKFSSK
jgi:hypothetical protein